MVKRLSRQIVPVAREQQSLTIGRNVVQMNTFAAISEPLRKTIGEIHQIECTAIAPTGLAVVRRIQLFERAVVSRTVFIARNNGKLRRGRQRERTFGQSRRKRPLAHRGRVEQHKIRPPIGIALEIQLVGFRHPRAVQIFSCAE